MELGCSAIWEEFPPKISKKFSNSMQIRRVGAELFQADGQTDTTKLTVACGSFGNAPNKRKCGLHDLNRKQLLLQDVAELRVPTSGRDSPQPWISMTTGVGTSLAQETSSSARVITGWDRYFEFTGLR
jgi:hypothetical protein